jgi:hypothetical protein
MLTKYEFTFRKFYIADIFIMIILPISLIRSSINRLYETEFVPICPMIETENVPIMILVWTSGKFVSDKKFLDLFASI